MKPPAETPSRMGTVLLGIARVARGRKDGLLQFGDTPEAVLAALAPLVAFLLVGAVLGLVSGSRGSGRGRGGRAVILLLAPLVDHVRVRPALGPRRPVVPLRRPRSAGASGPRRRCCSAVMLVMAC